MIVGKIRVALLKALYVLSYYFLLDSLFYLLNTRAKRIITFHNVMPDDLQSVLRVGVSESVTSFKHKLDEMSRRFSFSTDFTDPKSITITFDDGTLNEYAIAGDILHSRNIPAVLYIAGDIIGATPLNMLITDKLLLWCASAPDEAISKAFGVKVNRKELWVKYIQPRYRADVHSRGQKFLEKLESYCPITAIYSRLPKEWVLLRMSGVSIRQLLDLKSWGWTIGWHTKSHYPLAMLDDASRLEELDCPKEYRSVVFSYPYGDIGSVGVKSIDLVKKLGYPCAVSNDPDWSPHQGRFFMMRMTLPENKYELHFILSGAKYFCKHRRLLPKIV